jgi:hypothetical protein
MSEPAHDNLKRLKLELVLVIEETTALNVSTE